MASGAFSTPTMRLLLLWLTLTPLLLLALAVLFAVIAVGDENWALLGAMVALMPLAVALFFGQRRIVGQYLKKQG
ncbi:MAG TPA: hypothetical protein VNL15_02475 [Dehalococcoidia bacterium]|nr:hypothetical protein [Dehalococcoidia bacterium]